MFFMSSLTESVLLLLVVYILLIFESLTDSIVLVTESAADLCAA